MLEGLNRVDRQLSKSKMNQPQDVEIDIFNRVQEIIDCLFSLAVNH